MEIKVKGFYFLVENKVKVHMFEVPIFDCLFD